MTSPGLKSLVVGASAGLGRAVAEALAEAGHDLFLVASDRRDLDPVARDLSLRFGRSVHWLEVDLLALDLDALRSRVAETLGRVDNLFLLAGQAFMAEDGEPLPDAKAERLVEVNLTAPLRIANAFLAEMMAGGGNMVGAGSVAAVRGRSNNMVYGAAKRGLESYFEALRHRLGATGCRIQFYRLGYLRTRMTAGQKLPFPAMTPEAAAAAMVANLGKDLGTVYLPAWWAVIMGIIAALPWPVFRRLKI